MLRGNSHDTFEKIPGGGSRKEVKQLGQTSTKKVPEPAKSNIGACAPQNFILCLLCPCRWVLTSLL